MNPSNENKEKQNRANEAKLWWYIAKLEKTILMCGGIAVLLAVLAAFSPDSADFAVAPIALALGMVTIFTYGVIGTIRTELLKRFREIDELKKEIQELKNTLMQK